MDERLIVLGNAARKIDEFQRGFVKRSSILSGMLAGLSLSTRLSDSAEAQDYVQDALLYLVNRPTPPQKWKDLRALSNRIMWKGNNLVIDNYRRRLAQIARDEKASGQAKANRIDEPIRFAYRIFQPGGIDAFRDYLTQSGNKLDLDALIFFNFCLRNDAAHRPTDARGITYNVPYICSVLAEQTGEPWSHTRCQNARRHMVKQAQKFEGEDQ